MRIKGFNLEAVRSDCPDYWFLPFSFWVLSEIISRYMNVQPSPLSQRKQYGISRTLSSFWNLCRLASYIEKWKRNPENADILQYSFMYLWWQNITDLNIVRGRGMRSALSYYYSFVTICSPIQFPAMSPPQAYLFEMRSANGSGMMFSVPLFCHFSCSHYLHSYKRTSLHTRNGFLTAQYCCKGYQDDS
jgi:hypothetical protein